MILKKFLSTKIITDVMFDFGNGTGYIKPLFIKDAILKIIKAKHNKNITISKQAKIIDLKKYRKRG